MMAIIIINDKSHANVPQKLAIIAKQQAVPGKTCMR